MRWKLSFLIALVLIAATVPFAAVQAQSCSYTVKGGDTIAKIATMHGLKPWELQEMNDDLYSTIWNGIIQPGWVLRVPCLGDASPALSTATPVPGAVTVTGTPKYVMNMRGGPGTGYAIVGKAAGGVTVTLQARNSAGNWVIGTNSSGQRGWLGAWLMTISGDINSLPVSSEIIAQQATPPPTGTAVAPTSGPPASAQPYIGEYSNFIAARIKDIYRKGQARGNRANRFTKVGDSETANPYFLYQYDTGDYNLAQYGYLGGMLTTFKGSFGRDSQGARGGFVVDSLLDPLWANPQLCKAGETTIECEYRTYKPSIALILVRTYPNPEYQAKYEANVRKVIELTLKYNIIPVISTVPYLPPHDWGIDMNNTIRRLAVEYQIPLWDIYATTHLMPSNGISYETAHLSVPPDGSACNLSEPNLSTYGTVRRNLEALEVLHYVTTLRK